MVVVWGRKRLVVWRMEREGPFVSFFLLFDFSMDCVLWSSSSLSKVSMSMPCWPSSLFLLSESTSLGASSIELRINMLSFCVFGGLEVTAVSSLLNEQV